MRRNIISSGVCFCSNSGFTAQFVPCFFESLRWVRVRPAATILMVLAATIYFGTVGLSWGAPPAVAINIDASLQKLALHAKQTITVAQVAGVHSQMAKISAVDKSADSGSVGCE
jgi:hypothetical protein